MAQADIRENSLSDVGCPTHFVCQKHFVFSLYTQDAFCQEENTMFFKNMKIVFRKPSIGTTTQRSRGRQKGIFSSLDAFLQEEFERDIEPAISPKRTLDFAFTH